MISGLATLALVYLGGWSRTSSRSTCSSCATSMSCRPEQVIISGIVHIARELDIAILAEGVESEQELTVLRAAGISLFQGYLFAKPAFMSLPEVPLLGSNSRGAIGVA